MALSTCGVVVPPKARSPDTISYRTAPKLKMSDRASRRHPCACSGGRRDVAVHDAMAMSRSKRRRNLLCKRARLVAAHRPAQCSALDVLHHQEVDVVLASEIVEGADVRVVQRRDGPRLAHEAG
jgi:hypothetical protein